MEKVRKMTTDGHIKGSSVSHNSGKENVSEIGGKRMSYEEFDWEMAEMKARVDVLMKLLQESDQD